VLGGGAPGRRGPAGRPAHRPAPRRRGGAGPLALRGRAGGVSRAAVRRARPFETVYDYVRRSFAGRTGAPHAIVCRWGA
jgi:hypothetical protein